MRKLRLSQDLKEFAIVWAVMTLVLLPVRLVFVEFVSDSTVGSLGIISIISASIIVLAEKKKLGRFGKMLERQMFKNTHGKRRIFAVIFLGVTLFYLSTSLVAIELGNTVYLEEKEFLKYQIEHVEGINLAKTESVAQVLTIQNIIAAIPQYFDSLVFNFKEIAIIQAVINDSYRGMIGHFHIVFLAEELEIVGLYIFFLVIYQKKKEVCTKN